MEKDILEKIKNFYGINEKSLTDFGLDNNTKYNNVSVLIEEKGVKVWRKIVMTKNGNIVLKDGRVIDTTNVWDIKGV